MKDIKNMEEYLKPTELCDCDNSEIKKTANKLVQGTESPDEGALKIFYFVRDEIFFGGASHHMKASEILKRRVGDGCLKTNLQIALMRAVWIPARCHFAYINSRVLKPILPESIYNKFQSIIPHCWCECYVFGKWISCESLFDKILFEQMIKKGVISEKQIHTIDWDGKSDLILFKNWILEDKGIFSSCDDALQMLSKVEVNQGLFPKIVNDTLFEHAFYSIYNQHINEIRKSMIKMNK